MTVWVLDTNVRRVLARMAAGQQWPARSTTAAEIALARSLLPAPLPWNDPQLRFPMSQGFQYCGIIEGYLPEDHESCGNAAPAKLKSMPSEAPSRDFDHV